MLLIRKPIIRLSIVLILLHGFFFFPEMCSPILVLFAMFSKAENEAHWEARAIYDPLPFKDLTHLEQD